MKEIWKDVVGYEDLYKVSNLGNVYSYYTNKNLSQGTHNDGYKFVILRRNGQQKFALVHRLVAEAFIENKNNLPIINHKDENPANNFADNLEWCDYSYNNTYNNVHIKRGKAISKTTYAYDNNGDLCYEFYSTQEAGRQLGFSAGDINACCTGKISSYKSFVWSYEKLSKQDVLNRFEEIKNRESFESMQQKNNNLSKPVNQYTLDGAFICTYPSVHEAGRQLGFSWSLVAGVCRGEHKQTHGFVFKYA